ncbi:aspartyl protease [Rhizoctonia solani AG-3 Rhs1AP]|uniref:Aspartyl protease n=2 Tax=Rhizoctonia solani AG-3 TaxID=1086053 RepID=A0A074RGY1_9AGAM|nr:aspartyl protease [Rhizoctonia solani AG-3 Rhs1AP]KEP46029.1 aspartyl protease [Rhizoctonia solani 123E]
MKYHAGLVVSLLSTLATAKPPSKLGVCRNASELKPLDIPIKITRGYNTIQLQLGTPPQPVDLYFDTGAASLWVLTPECAKNCPSYYYHRSSFDTKVSSTAQPTYWRETENYVDGDAISGEVWLDKVTIQNITFPTPQRFISADTSSAATLPAGGNIGLAFPSLAPGRTSIHETLFHPTHLPDHRIGIYPGNVKYTEMNPSPQTNGIVTFGGSHEDKYGAEPLKWINVIPDYSIWGSQYTYWHVPINGVKTSRHTTTGPNETRFSPQPGAVAIFDTGSSLIWVPRSIISDLSSALGYNYTAYGQGVFPLCSEVATYNASLTLTFGDVEITVTSDDLSEPGHLTAKNCWPPLHAWDSPNWTVWPGACGESQG